MKLNPIACIPVAPFQLTSWSGATWTQANGPNLVYSQTVYILNRVCLHDLSSCQYTLSLSMDDIPIQQLMSGVIHDLEPIWSWMSCTHNFTTLHCTKHECLSQILFANSEIKRYWHWQCFHSTQQYPVNMGVWQRSSIYCGWNCLQALWNVRDVWSSYLGATTLFRMYFAQQNYRFWL